MRHGKKLDDGRKLRQNRPKPSPFVRLTFGEKHEIANFMKENPGMQLKQYAEMFTKKWHRNVTERLILAGNSISKSIQGKLWGLKKISINGHWSSTKVPIRATRRLRVNQELVYPKQNAKKLLLSLAKTGKADSYVQVDLFHSLCFCLYKFLKME